MNCTLFTLQRNHPHRPPDWRWHLAQYLAGKPDSAAGLASADLWVAQAILLVQDLAQSSGANAGNPTAMRAAYDIYAGVDRLRRWEIEAYLLTREPLEQIAERCSLSRDVLAVYAEVFFHVRDRLQASIYIVDRVIGPTAHAGLTEDDAGTLLKIVGYRAPTGAIELILKYYRGAGSTPVPTDPCDPRVLKEAWEMMMAKVWIIARTLPVIAVVEQAAEVLDHVQKYLALPDPGKEISTAALAARLRVADQALEEVRACIASARTAS